MSRAWRGVFCLVQLSLNACGASAPMNMTDDEHGGYRHAFNDCPKALTVDWDCSHIFPPKRCPSLVPDNSAVLLSGVE
jgi:hypothetical protein